MKKLNNVLQIFCILFMLSFLTSSAKSQSNDCPHGSFDHENGTLNCLGNIHVLGKIDGGSQVTLISSQGSVVIDDKVDGGSTLVISCLGSVYIGNKIDGSSRVSIRCTGDITIGDKIDGGAQCDFYSENGQIHVIDKTDNSSTTVRYHSKYSIRVDKGTNRANIVQY